MEADGFVGGTTAVALEVESDLGVAEALEVGGDLLGAAVDEDAGHFVGPDLQAGEGTGAAMMPRFRFIYDGIASMLAILTMMRDRGRKISEILAGYPVYEMRKGQVPLESPRVPDLLMALENEYSDGKINTTDGLRVDWADRWFHVRVSQTEPVVRVICEQRGRVPKALFDALMDRVRRMD